MTAIKSRNLYKSKAYSIQNLNRLWQQENQGHKEIGATQRNPKQETAVNDSDIRTLEEKFRFNAISIDTIT